MANDKLYKLMITGFTMLLFIWLISYFVISMGADYGKDISETDNKINLTGVNQTLVNLQEDTESFRGLFKGFVNVDNIVGTANLFVSMFDAIVLPFTLTFSLFVNVLGIPPVIVSIVFGTITALIILAGLFGIWSLLRKGD